jgi:hypothetical protein
MEPNTSCPCTAQSAWMVGRTPWSAADALVGLAGSDEAEFVDDERVRGDPRGPGGPPHDFSMFRSLWEN